MGKGMPEMRNYSLFIFLNFKFKVFNYEQKVSKCNPVQRLNGGHCRNVHFL